MRKQKQPIQTHVTIDDNEFEVAVFYDYQPEESDTNTAAGIEITSVFYEDEGCIMDQVSDDELESLGQRIIECLYGDDDGYGDYLYEQRKDERLGL